MKVLFLLVLSLALAGALIAGCTGRQTTLPPSPTPVTEPSQPSGTLPQQPSFTAGEYYLNKPGGYSFQSEKDVVVEQFRVDNPSWVINLKVKPLHEDPQYCWFKITIKNEDTGLIDSYGYGREFSIDPDQTIPMYNKGPYMITMKGNRVKVWVIAAKRLP